MDDSDGVVKDEWEDYESGPYCSHWAEPGYCDELCENPKCGHKCSDHGGSCDVEDCDCQQVQVEGD